MNATIRRISCAFSALILTWFCACSATETPNSHPGNEIGTRTESTAQSPVYVGDFASDPGYQAIMSIETCTDPDSLCTLLEALYGEPFTYITLEIDDEAAPATQEALRYKPPYADYICRYSGLFNSLVGNVPVQSDTHLFFREYHEQPSFMMDADSTCIVHSYQIHHRDDETSWRTVTGFVLSDLYLNLHGYIPDNEEDKAFKAGGVQAMAYYMELEEHIAAQQNKS